MSFKKIGLKEPILKALQQKGYKEPTPIQKMAIASIIKNKDVMAAAQTGTGKQLVLPCLFWKFYPTNKETQTAMN